ncbi:histidine phosphatase family protein [Tritonibacter scottomollicae]|uniref:Histidine phosphatase family protein n=1 Tax=Tritonibacter scottomollicae TaxID=483013 RepID=A0ABZ0HC90_TRISK|nr:histidine phosphatase family protein [Tritonibacter scottomollicae]WOI32082.1 histidine phosphatase family protein [Tritonibacter scottomollicae]
MTCTLFLTRHAKSAWNTDAPSDHARPLNKRGRRSAGALGNWLRQQSAQPQQVLSSSAQRTRETYELMELPAPATFTERLYHASAQIIFDVLREASKPNVLLLGHNPGLMQFAHDIVKHPPAHSRFEDYPTGATLMVQFEIASWDQLQTASGRVLDFVVPRELLGE